MQKLIDSIENLFDKNGQSRLMLGICGAPAAGKSTLAAWLVDKWNLKYLDEAVLVPMDGFHLSNNELERLGLLALKGIPETFNAQAFVDKLNSVRGNPKETHFCPRFDRRIEASEENAIEIKPSHKLLVVEGNYLLLDTAPWNEIERLLDEIWFIRAEEKVLWPRLLLRHQEGGKSLEQAKAKVESTDIANARLIASSCRRANRIIESQDLDFDPGH